MLSLKSQTADAFYNPLKKITVMRTNWRDLKNKERLLKNVLIETTSYI